MTAQRKERLLHWLILFAFLLNAVWILWIPSFPTLDGWTHLHTARMLFEGAPDGIYCENPGMVPNRVGHLLLGALQSVMPGLIAERLLLALILLGTGLGVWSLARSLGRPSPLILLALPFTVNFMLVLGFHNFLLGVALALLFAAAWIAMPKLTWVGLAGMLAASIILFYTHTTALALFLMIAGAYEAFVVFGLAPRESALPGGRWMAASTVLIACLPALFLFLDFNASQKAVWGTADQDANLRDLFDLRSIVLYHYAAEEKFTYAMKLLLVATGIVACYARWLSGWRITTRDIPLLLSVLLFTLYFVLPDSSGYASYITVRLQWMALLLFITWIALQPIPLLATMPLVAMVLLTHQARSRYISTAMAPMAERIDQVRAIAKELPANSVVLPINTEANWQLGHAASLLATEKPIALLDNYECGTGYFPYVWCTELPDKMRQHLGGASQCLEWLPAHVEGGQHPRIDRIVVLGYDRDPGHCRANTLRDVLVRHYRKGPSTPYATVYELVR